MSPIDQLVKAARKKRNAQIQKARDDYDDTIRELAALARKMGQPVPRPTRKKKPKAVADGFPRTKISKAVEIVLNEASKPMDALEITIEIQRRGCRDYENPRHLIRAVRASLHYFNGRKFSQDAEGRWALA